MSTLLHVILDRAPALATLAQECKGCHGTLCKGCHGTEQHVDLLDPWICWAYLRHFATDSRNRPTWPWAGDDHGEGLAGFPVETRLAASPVPRGRCAGKTGQAPVSTGGSRQDVWVTKVTFLAGSRATLAGWIILQATVFGILAP